MTYPVHYAAERPVRYRRPQLALRVAVFLLLGLVGASVGLILAIAYIGLAAFAALRFGDSNGAKEAYFERDAPRVLRALTWLGAFLAWLGLVTDKIPQSRPEAIVRIAVDPDAPRPRELSPGSALLRILLGLPSALLLALLYVVGAFVWLWSALRILVDERVGDLAHAYLTGVQRWTIRLLVYQASLVEPYPPFGFEDQPAAYADRASA